MSTPSSTSHAPGRASTGLGILLGLVILGLVAAFAIGLPKVTGDETAALRLSLPDRLPGGYLAADDEASFQGGQLEAQAQEIAASQAAARTYGDKVLPKALGTAAVTRTYVAHGSDAVFVQAFQSTGGAFAPNSLSDPASSGGQAMTVMKRVGDGVCILSYTQPGTPAPAFSQCQVTRGEVTTQLGSTAVTPDDLVTLGDHVLAAVSGS